MERKLDRLHTFQTTEDTPEIRAMLPHLERSDLERRYKGVPVCLTDVAGVPHHFYQLPTAGIDYLYVYFDVSGVPLSDMPYLSLLAKLLFNVSTEKRDLLSYQNDTDTNLGGIGANILGYEKEILIIRFSSWMQNSWMSGWRMRAA